MLVKSKFSGGENFFKKAPFKPKMVCRWGSASKAIVLMLTHLYGGFT